MLQKLVKMGHIFALMPRRITGGSLLLLRYRLFARRIIATLGHLSFILLSIFLFPSLPFLSIDTATVDRWLPTPALLLPRIMTFDVLPRFSIQLVVLILTGLSRFVFVLFQSTSAFNNGILRAVGYRLPDWVDYLSDV